MAILETSPQANCDGQTDRMTKPLIGPRATALPKNNRLVNFWKKSNQKNWLVNFWKKSNWKNNRLVNFWREKERSNWKIKNCPGLVPFQCPRSYMFILLSLCSPCSCPCSLQHQKHMIEILKNDLTHFAAHPVLRHIKISQFEKIIVK